MESFGSVSMASPLATIERVPSMAESSGAFSAATEAESEMTDEGVEDAITPRQTYFMCFATDLLSAYEQIKKRGLAGAKAIDDLCVMIKTRVGLEETYAKGLEKTANQAFKDELEPGTFREALEGLRSDLVNKAVQHRQLAKNLTTDVLEPLSELRGQLSTKSKVLISRAYKLQRDTRALDEKYRRSHSKYQRCHREAAACLTAAVEGGAVPRIGSRHKHASSLSTQRIIATAFASSPPGGGTGSPEPKTLAAGKAVGGSPGSSPTQAPSLSQSLSESQGVRRRTMSVTLEKVREAMPSGSNKKDLVQWFLPSEKNRKEALIESAQQGADAAEEARKACRACWIALRAGIHNAAKEFQKVVTDFQWCEEQLVSEAQDAMRKHVVFESSTLANQQYDLQMLFKVMESVNVEIDLRNFIRSARREVANDAAVAAQVALAAENEAPEAMVTATATEVKAKKAAAEAEKISEAAVTGVLVTNGNGSADGGGNRGGGGGRGGQRRASVEAFARAGVLSSRADSRATALAFQRLFGVGPDLPAPPMEEAWVPPEVEGESPSASLQNLADLFRVPLMTKEDISKYLDATDPAAGAAASESAAAAIKALGSPAASDNAANDWRAAATKDAQTDATLAKLPSPYPMVTPASSVFEVLGFAAQTRHAENYAAIVATAASHGSLGREAVKNSGGGGTKGTGLGGLGAGTPTEESSKSAVVVTTPMAAVAEAASTAATAAAATVEAAALAIVDGGSGTGSKDCGTETPSLSSGTTSTSLSAVGSDGMSAIFAAAAAAFGAADTPKPPPPMRPIPSSSSPLTPTLTSTRAAAGGGVGTSTVRVSPPGPEEAESTRAAEAPQAADGSSNNEGDDSGMRSLPVVPSYSATSRAPDPLPPVPASTPAPSATAKTNSGCKSPSPSLLLVSERPSVFAATLADDVLESLYADGAGATEGDREPGEPSDGGGCEDDFDPAAAVARAVEALIGRPGEALDGAKVDAAEKACRESGSSSSKLLLTLCKRACACAASPPEGPSNTDSADLGGVVRGEGFTPILLPPESFAGFARLLRASLDQANSGREFLKARNCLVASGLYAVRGADYVAWLRAAEATTASGGVGGGGSGGDVLAVMADSELVSAAGALDRQNRLDSRTSSTAGGESAGDREDLESRGRRVASWGRVVGKDAAVTDAAGAGAADYLLQRELRRHPVWRTIELWEVSMSDSVVMAVGGGGSRAERWLPADTLSALDERFGNDAAGRQLDLKLGQLAFLGHSMLACGVAPSEVRSLVRKCSSLAMEIPSADLEALMAALNTFVVGPRSGQGVALSDRPRSGNFQASRLPHPSLAADENSPEPNLDFDEGTAREGHSRGIDVEGKIGSSSSGSGGDGDAGDRNNGDVTGSEDNDDEGRSSGSSESSRSDSASDS